MMAEHIEWLGSVFGGTDVLQAGDLCDYFDVIYDSFSVHVDREKIRNGLWKDYPAEDQVRQIKAKTDRVLRSLEQLPRTGVSKDEFVSNITEELLDIINYANFAVRIVNGRVG
jgi:hypothetical protein